MAIVISYKNDSIVLLRSIHDTNDTCYRNEYYVTAFERDIKYPEYSSTANNLKELFFNYSYDEPNYHIFNQQFPCCFVMFRHMRYIMDEYRLETIESVIEYWKEHYDVIIYKNN